MFNRIIGFAVICFAACGGFGGETGLLGHWPMDEGSGVVCRDASGNGHDASVRNETGCRWGEGRDGSALYFQGENGKGAFLFAELPTLDSSNAFTVTAWVKADPGQEREGVYALVANAGGDLRPKGFLMAIHYQRLCLINGTPDGSQQSACSLVHRNPFPYGTWAHFAVTFDGTFKKCYLDGQLVATSDESNSGPLQGGLKSVSIGSAAGYCPFFGAIGDVKIYSRALSYTEIARTAKGLDH